MFPSTISEHPACFDAVATVLHEWKAIADSVATHASHGYYPPGYVLATEGREAHQIIQIDSGLVKLVQAGPDGDDVVVGVRGRGWPLGLESATLRAAHQMSIVTLTECAVLAIDVGAFRARVFSDLAVATRLVRLHSLLALDSTRQLAAFGSLSARRRLELLLGLLADAFGRERADGTVWLKLSPPQREWAEIIWVAPETLSRLMTDLERDEVVRRAAGAVIITNRTRLVGREVSP
jgi:CRP/FNR family transcriptional regulator, cyclic AMP receptor protein